jgi:hypothetical protein
MSNVTLKMNVMLHLGAIANVHDLCSGANQCDDDIMLTCFFINYPNYSIISIPKQALV